MPDRRARGELAAQRVIRVLPPVGHLALTPDLVLRKWDYTGRRRPGRPSTGSSVKALIVRMARENPAWGHRPRARRAEPTWRDRARWLSASASRSAG
jgi:hypothetical protein